MESTRRGKRSSSKSRSRSRTRSRSRSRSRGRKVEKTPKTEKKVSEKVSSSPARTKSSPARRRSVERAVTPTRRSARLENKGKEPEEKKVVEIPVMEERKRVSRTTRREFGGAIGAFLFLFMLPLTVYGLNMMCSKKNKCLPLPGKIEIPTKLKDYFDWEATAIFLGWFVFQSILYMLPIGQVVKGQQLRSGGYLKYRCNGFLALMISLAAFGGAVYLDYPVQKVHQKFIPLVTAGTIFSFLMSLFLYIKARRGPSSKLAPGGNTGNVLYDFFIGHELNPRIGDFDLKFFCELRPGLIGWLMINLVFLTEAYKAQHALPPALTMVVVFQALYVADALWFEDAILTTMDIISDGFGFMLVFGDLVWVPFLYCLQTRYLQENEVSLPWYCLVGIGILNMIGYFIFRGSNSQKNEFRKNPYNPALAHLETIPTSTGKKLLVSGWWGYCHKPNYLGDIIMALSWSLACGSKTPLVYFYPVYFTILLIHRERRDSEHCAKKYKASWTRYCERVKYRICPYIY